MKFTSAIKNQIEEACEQLVEDGKANNLQEALNKLADALTYREVIEFIGQQIDFYEEIKNETL